VGRFQINATSANNVHVAITPQVVAHVRSLMAQLPRAEFILQRNAETEPLWAALEAVLRRWIECVHLGGLGAAMEHTGLLARLSRAAILPHLCAPCAEDFVRGP
jgi:hypothetical protein